MHSYADIEIEIDERGDILRDILLKQRDFEFLDKPGSPELVRFINTQPLLIRSKQWIFKLLCIEVHKLYSKSPGDKFRLGKLIDDMNKYYASAEWNKYLPKEDLEVINAVFDNTQKNKALEYLNVYRDKYLAHTDPQRSDHSISFFIGDFYDLITDVTIIDILRKQILKRNLPLRFLEEDGFDKIEILVGNR